MKKEVSLYLSDERIGSLTIDQVRGRETYMFRYASEYLKSERPMLDPAIRNVAGCYAEMQRIISDSNFITVRG